LPGVIWPPELPQPGAFLNDVLKLTLPSTTDDVRFKASMSLAPIPAGGGVVASDVSPSLPRTMKWNLPYPDWPPV
jgi:hypothetical protein